MVRNQDINARGTSLNGELHVYAGGARFEQLYQESYTQIFNYVYYRVLDRMAAEDITEDAFLKAARAFNRFDPKRARFSTWVTAIARNCVNDYFRALHTSVPIENVPEDTFAREDEYPALNEDAQTAHRLLEVLQEEERELVFMKYFEDMRNKDIAEALNMNPSTVATKLQRALEKMHAYAQKEGL